MGEGTAPERGAQGLPDEAGPGLHAGRVQARAWRGAAVPRFASWAGGELRAAARGADGLGSGGTAGGEVSQAGPGGFGFVRRATPWARRCRALRGGEREDDPQARAGVFEAQVGVVQGGHRRDEAQPQPGAGGAA